ncbi:2'-5' RNA ligase family protein [Hymenobacter armeniacus]|uniref:2'-5' RNA ligase family protein n=1 Tax=Hymenobacter armeniacus TaxID=2771358 RepID=A0ABR8JNP8_9BACT|nr:2'-5' RNA ligase family protein [Hymenobacter armeniacus]MBD2720538.1 2'-5' RNA ligase family protein [Hymenobacter armeniacus]
MPDLAAPAPLILTLMLDEASQAYFDELRRLHFPPRINYLAAHLTLFHHLPGDDLPGISARLGALCRAQAPLPLQVTGLRSLGRGVAFTLENNELRALHRRLQTEFAAVLTPQDQQKLQPHVTIQNKVTPDDARQLLAALQPAFAPFAAVGTGLHLWAYRNGPWESLAEFPFDM